MENKRGSKKKAMTQLKVYFLIINVVLATIAFSWMVSSSLIPISDPVDIDTLDYNSLSSSPSPTDTNAFSEPMDIDKFILEETQASNQRIQKGLQNLDNLIKDMPEVRDYSSEIIKAEQELEVFELQTTIEENEEYIEFLEDEMDTLLDDMVEIGKEKRELQSQLDTLTKDVNTLKSQISQATESITPKAGMTGSIEGIGNIELVKSGDKLGYIKNNQFQELTEEQLKNFKATQKVQCEGPLCGVTKMFSKTIFKNLFSALTIGGMFALVGSFIGDNAPLAGFLSGFGGTMAYHIMKNADYGILHKAVQGTFGKLGIGPELFGVGVGATIFLLMYKKTSTEIVEFNCHPWEAPIGGKDCELCNDIQGGCSEYRCKSLGQACQLLNKGTEDEKCAWVNPHDVNSPIIKIGELLEDYKWEPDKAVRPPATGVVISENDGSCVEAFTPLEFTIETDEPSQCKIDYNLTRGFEEMSYYFGGSNLFAYNHTETMSLPGPDAINKIAPELKNDGTYTLYVRCQDANGNFNQDAFSVRFCVEKGPDATAPRIVDLSVPSNFPIQYNKSELDLEVYVNEPAECKWSREDRTFDNMENLMSCSTNLWEMNNRNVYTCTTTLTGIKDRQENDFYFRCKDQPNAQEGDRNVNTQSYKYTIIGTQPLNILEVSPNETIKGATDTIPVLLTVKTDNGHDNGKAVCYYSTTENEKDYIEFAETGSNEHSQRQDLATGSYKYYFKCVDLGGNAAYDSTEFNVEVDESSPTVVRVYKESDLKIITNEKSICSYSTKDCNFNIEDGISMPYENDEIHTAEWKVNQNYYIRCKDEYDNQADPNRCSIVVRPYDLGEDVIEL